MAQHDRLRPPTLEAPKARARTGLPAALALVVLAAGFAYAMPRAQITSAEGAEQGTDQVEVIEVASPTATPTETDPAPDPTDDDGGEPAKDNHGKAVSTAAHCDVHGRAHGALVRSIAKDKDATVADAEAACAAAIAAAEAAPDEHGKPDKDTGKPEHAGKPGDDDVDASGQDKDSGSSKHDDRSDDAEHAGDTDGDSDDDSEEDPEDHGKPDKPKD